MESGNQFVNRTQWRVGNIIQFEEKHKRASLVTVVKTDIRENISKKRNDTERTVVVNVHIGKIKEIYDGCIEVLERNGAGYRLKDADPILLNHQILEQCGFQNKEGYYQKTIGGKRNLTLAYPADRSSYELSIIDFSLNRKHCLILDTNLFELHRLMNLYYSICKEELIWNEFPETVDEMLAKHPHPVLSFSIFDKPRWKEEEE